VCAHREHRGVARASQRCGEHQQPARPEQLRSHRRHLAGVAARVQQVGAEHDVKLLRHAATAAAAAAAVSY
jgi:hypothetical protein